MKKTLVLILIASMLLAGCGQSIDAVADSSVSASVSASSEASAVVPEPSPPESTAPEAPPPQATAPETSEPLAEEKPQFEHDWQALYYDELIKPVKSGMAMFNIYDLDSDGTPELLLSEGPFHAAGGALVTVYQGELARFGLYGGWGEFQYDFERNYIHSSYWQMGSGWLDIYHFENGKADKIISFYMYDGSFPETEKEFKINDEDVSEAVFDAEYDKYSFDFRKREDFIIRKHEITLDTVERVLRQY